MDLNEAKKNLEACLGEDLKREYFAILQQWYMFKSPITKEDFDRNVRKILVNEEQIRCHNYFLLSILAKISSTNRPKHVRSADEKGVFECADFADYVQPSSPTGVPPSDYEIRSAAAELFMPDSGFIACRIAVTAWENGIEGADDAVTEVVVHACQVFVKNIITAMITRSKGYKIRDHKFQYGFNLPIPNPFTHNFNNVTDETQCSKVSFEEDALIPKCKLSLERAEQEVAFAYSSAKRKKRNNTLNVNLLYKTLKENPKLLGLHSIHSVNLLKLGLILDDDDEDEFKYESSENMVPDLT